MSQPRVRSIFFILILLLVLLLTGVVVADGKTAPGDLQVSEVKYTHCSLDNGLQIYVFEDYRVPLVEVNLWYKVGSLDESKSLSGISHLLEHLMFLGTKTLQKDQVHTLVRQVGGSNNAETSYAYTKYYEKVPAANLELAIAIEADRMHNLVIDAAEFTREKEVVKQEQRRNSRGSSSTSALKVISPHYDIIGSIKSINSLTVEQVLNHYRRYYVPNNAILAVAGAVAPQRVLELARKYFGEYQPKTIERLTSVADSKAEQPVVIETPTVVQPYIVMRYKLPAGDHPDLPALKIVLNILQSKLSATMQWEKKLISSVDCDVSILPESTQAKIVLCPKTKNNFAPVEAGVDAELSDLIQYGINEDTLKCYKVYFLRDMIFDQREPNSFSERVIKGVILFNDPEFYRREIQYVNAVTKDDLIRVAQKYLTKEQRVLYYIIPPKKR
ncbi:MAG TPA: pitrilysin family protein [Bacillota bacterium]|nr:pitrilysin family protein [Bacillota bacterium]